MEGTVTISLKDYEELREDVDYYRELAFECIRLLEEIEEFLNVEKIESELLKRVTDVLDNYRYAYNFRYYSDRLISDLRRG